MDWIESKCFSLNGLGLNGFIYMVWWFLKQFGLVFLMYKWFGFEVKVHTKLGPYLISSMNKMLGINCKGPFLLSTCIVRESKYWIHQNKILLVKPEVLKWTTTWWPGRKSWLVFAVINDLCLINYKISMVVRIEI